MLAQALVAVALTIFGLPKSQLGDPLPARPTGPTDQFLRQVAVARIQSVDRHELVLQRPGAPLRIHLEPATVVRLPDGLGDIRDLAPGQRVRVSYDAYRGPPQANWVEVLAAPAPPAPMPRSKP